ncbi:MAG: hypothetical protein RR994_01865, partial [Clostridia bacterium]
MCEGWDGDDGWDDVRTNTQVRAYCIFSTCRFARYIFDPIFSRLSVRAPSYIHANNGFTPTGF